MDDRRRAGLRPPKTKCPPLNTVPIRQPPLTNKERCQAFRERRKQHQSAYEAFKAQDAERKRADRANRTQEQKQRDRESSRKRSREYLARKRLKESTTPKRTTRNDAKTVALRREKNRISQQKRRLNMSSQKKTAEKLRNRAYVREKRMQKDSANQITKSLSVSDCKLSNLFSTPMARRSAAYRAKKALPVRSIVGAVRSLFKKDPLSMKNCGVSYSSPTKVPPTADIDLEVQAIAALRSKRDKQTLNAKNVLSVAMNKIKDTLNVSSKTRGITKKYLLSNTKVRKLYAVRKENKVKMSVISFYREHSIHLPGKESAGKKILDKPIKELYQLYVKSFPSLPVSQATFFRLRPKTILSYMKTPLRQCLCEICQNPRLKLDTLNRHCERPYTSVTELLLSTMCHTINEFPDPDCLNRKCLLCKNKLFSILSDAPLEKTVTWKRWEKVKKSTGSRLDLVKKEGCLKDFLAELTGELSTLPMHIFTHRWQSKMYSQLYYSLPRGWTLAIMDFAENYLCVQQDQPQAAYFGYNQVTLHPVVLKYACKFCGEQVDDVLVFVSDILKHDAHFVEYVQKVTEQHLSAVSDTSKLVVFSDGCPGQYKSKVPFFYLSQQDGNVMIERCFFGSRHGKNPCDTVGGVVKSFVAKAVRARKVTVQNAEEFFEFCIKQMTKGFSNGCCHKRRSFVLVKEENVQVGVSAGDLKTVPGTRKLHSFVPLGNNKLATRNLTCFCLPCQESNFGACENCKYVNEWEYIKFASVEDDSILPVGTDCSREDFFSKVHILLTQCQTFVEIAQLSHKLLPAFKEWPIPVNSCTVLSVGGTIDSTANDLKPALHSSLFPVVIVADGNCMPRALSLAIFQSQEHHIEIRCRIICSMALNYHRYNSIFGSDMLRIAELSSCLSQRSIHDVGEVQQIYEREVLHTTHLCTDMSLWHLMAAADALGRQIISVYPRKGPECNWKLHNQYLQPSVVKHKQSIIVMWTSCRSDEMGEEYWVANHISLMLPLSQPVEVETES